MRRLWGLPSPAPGRERFATACRRASALKSGRISALAVAASRSDPRVALVNN